MKGSNKTLCGKRVNSFQWIKIALTSILGTITNTERRSTTTSNPASAKEERNVIDVKPIDDDKLMFELLELFGTSSRVTRQSQQLRRNEHERNGRWPASSGNGRRRWVESSGLSNQSEHRRTAVRIRHWQRRRRQQLTLYTGRFGQARRPSSYHVEQLESDDGRSCCSCRLFASTASTSYNLKRPTTTI